MPACNILFGSFIIVRLGQLNRIILCELQLFYYLQKVVVEFEYTTILLKTSALSGDKMAIDLEKKKIKSEKDANEN